MSIFNKTLELMSHKVHGHSYTQVFRYHKIRKVGRVQVYCCSCFTSFSFWWLLFLATIQEGKQTIPAKNINCKDNVTEVSAFKEGLKYIDDIFFNDSKVTLDLSYIKSTLDPVNVIFCGHTSDGKYNLSYNFNRFEKWWVVQKSSTYLCSERTVSW